MKNVVVTGVSSGIGWGAVKVLTKKGFHVFGSVRKEEDAKRLSAEFGDAFTPLLFDVTDEVAVSEAASVVSSRLKGKTLDGLVNNAGIAVPGPLMHQPIKDFRLQIEVNLVSVLIVTQSFLPLLGTDRFLSGKPGRIVNISSVGGQVAVPFIGGYHASKFALEGLSDTLRRELMLYGIDVIVVGPGAVATPIWDKAENTDWSLYQHTEYAEAGEKYLNYSVTEGRKGSSPEVVGEVIWKALSAPNPRVRYATVHKHLLNWTLPRLLPKRIVDKIIAKNLGFLNS